MRPLSIALKSSAGQKGEQDRENEEGHYLFDNDYRAVKRAECISSLARARRVPARKGVNGKKKEKWK